jgi:DNA-binding transcriptional LysR family regulator
MVRDGTSNPQIGIEIETQGSVAPFDLLAKGKIDLMMSPDMVLPGQLEAMDLFEDELVAVMMPNHMLAVKPMSRAPIS